MPGRHGVWAETDAFVLPKPLGAPGICGGSAHCRFRKETCNAPAFRKCRVAKGFGQKNISAAPAAIVMSLEGVVAAIAAWIILNQFLELNNIIGCLLILGGILLSQLAPIYEKNYK